MNIFAFIGPTISKKEAQEILDATYLPPIAMGDLYTLVETRAKSGDCIAIIDGLFEQVPAIWHKEILYALEKGVHVYGASSMGALRAAELHPFGMQGVGRIFEAYRDGIFEDDDEVTVGHAMEADGYKALSHSMASLRFGLQELHENGVLNTEQYRYIKSACKAMYYTRRSWGEVYQLARVLELDESALTQIKKYATSYDAKRDDAVTLLTHLRTLHDDREPPTNREFVLQNTVFWVGLCQSQQAKIRASVLEHNEHSLPFDELARHAKAMFKDTENVLDRALLVNLVSQIMHAYIPEEKELKAAQNRIFRANGLSTNKAIKQWLSNQKISNTEWHTMLELEAKLAKFKQQSMTELDPLVVFELKRTGAFAHVENSVLKNKSTLLRMGVNKPTMEDAGIEASELQGWYEQRCGKMDSNPEDFAHHLGFSTLRDFVNELLGTYLSETKEQMSDAQT